MALATYSSKDINVTWNGIDLSKGLAEDSWLVISPLTERKTTTFGADGQMCVSKMANLGATITMTFQQTAEVNKDIAAIAAASDVIGGDTPIGLFTVEASHANFICWNAVLTEVPENEFGNAVGEKTWTWICEAYILAEDPATVLASIDQYLITE